MKKLTSLLCCLLAFLTLAGCASMLEGEYSSVRQYSTDASGGTNPFPVIHANSYDDILDALITMITAGDKFGVIRIDAYPGDVEQSVNEACMEISNDTALGTYAVYYLTSTVNRIISYYDAEIHITYKRTPLEIMNITPVSNTQELEGELQYYLSVGSGRGTISVTSPEITPEYIKSEVTRLYYEDPALCAILPSVSVAEFPPDGEERILEINFSYPYTVARMTDMQEKAVNAAAEMADAVRELQPGEAVLQLCHTLAATVDYDLEREQSGSTDFNRSDLAFGALIDGKASGLGFAMALKMLCNEIDVECIVIHGRRDSMDHGWNMIRLGNDWYHVDASIFTQVGPEYAYLIGDAWMSDRCWWDQTLYPVCDGPLAYSDFAPASTFLQQAAPHSTAEATAPPDETAPSAVVAPTPTPETAATPEN